MIGNSLDLLPTLEDNSVDSIVTDPPYELGFMGKKWDSTGIAYNSDLWRECLRVLKPGGHLLSFGGSRTWHRIAVAIEDAGFEVRDSIAWMYGSGFPKSLNIAKSLEAKIVTGSAAKNGFHKLEGDRTGDGKIGMYATVAEQGFRKQNPEQLGSFDLSATTPEAQQWEGWGTALKPAFEPIIVARKPLIGTVAENVLTYGTGGLNIDGSRIAHNEPIKLLKPQAEAGKFYAQAGRRKEVEELKSNGRWPANVILDEYTAGLLDEQTAHLKGATSRTTHVDRSPFSTGVGDLVSDAVYGDTGGASRFFYVAKASKRDRNEGLEELAATYENRGNGFSDSISDTKQPRQNFHPTVKPTELMRYLVKLVTPPNGLVLDPFTGSGSTGKAALLEGFSFLGMEMTEDYIPIIEGRLRHAQTQVKEKEGLF